MIPFTSGIVRRAADLATRAHAGQMRKYTGAPYIQHPMAVAEIVATVARRPALISAALLHDVLEDTEVTEAALRTSMGDEVAELVLHLTDQIGPSAGNRATRKRLEAERLRRAPGDAQTIKVADLIDNTMTIVRHDPRFAAVYIAEKAYLLDRLQLAEPKLLGQARMQLDRARADLAGQ